MGKTLVLIFLGIAAILNSLEFFLKDVNKTCIQCTINNLIIGAVILALNV